MTETDADEDGWDGVQAALPGPRDPDLARVRALVESRLLGDALAPVGIGRYALLERVAAGAMGIVFAAYDRDLDRRVALKLLHADREHDAERRRMVREAQAMAKLSHPNVAHVYEVGEHEGRTFIAMELVEGETLRVWQNEAQRSVGETIAMYLQAGHGLAAAHAAGLVHRDFKPDNVLVGGDGRVRVADFGLARVHEASPEGGGMVETGPVHPGTTTRSAIGVVGSPAYMAPEQHAGRDVDARADQFAFCVSLWEALFGARPFAGASASELARAMESGAIAATTRSGVPARVRRVLLRGLRAAPNERWPKVADLLDALQRDRAATVRRGVLVVAAIGATGALSWWLARGPDPFAQCEAAASLADVWNPPRAQGLRAVFTASGKPYASASAETVIAGLDAWSSQWTQAHTDGCRATHVERTRSHAQLEAQLACLARAQQSAVALLDLLEAGDRAVLENAQFAVGDLPAIERCTDVRRIERYVHVAAADRDAADAVFGEIARTRQLVSSGLYGRALAVGEAALPAAMTLGYPHVEAELRYAIGQVHSALRAYDVAVDFCEQALALAIRAGADETAATITTELVYLDGYQRGRREVGHSWIVQAESWLDRIDRPWDREREFLVNRAYAVRTADRAAEALADFERALALQDEHDPDDDGERVAILAAIGNTQRMMGRLREAQSTMEEVVAILEETMGPDHPHYANELNSLASIYLELGDFARAEPMFERAIAIEEAALGPSAPQLLQPLGNLGSVYANTGRVPAAIAIYERIVATLPTDPEQMDGTESIILGNLCIMHQQNGDLARANEVLEQGLVAARTVAGEDSLDYAIMLLNGAAVAYARGDFTLALERARRADTLFTPKLGDQHPNTAFARMHASKALSQLGRPTEALSSGQQALAAFEAMFGPDHPDVASALHAVGRALADLGRKGEADAILGRARAIEARHPGRARVVP